MKQTAIITFLVIIFTTNGEGRAPITADKALGEAPVDKALGEAPVERDSKGIRCVWS